MKTTKKILSLLLCTIMIFGSVAIGEDDFVGALDIFKVRANANGRGSCGPYVEWDLLDGVLTISGGGAMSSNSFILARDEIKAVVINSGISSICDYAFSGCSNLTQVSILGSLYTIGNYAFDGCTNLSSITIPNGTVQIGSYAFHLCNSLRSINIPSEVTNIGLGAFSSCANLTSITVDGNNINYANDEYGILLNKDRTSLIQCPAGYPINEYSIPDSVKSIGSCAFSDCTSITNITIPNSVTNIDGWAFNNCTSLTSISLPDSVTSIGEYAFLCCRGLKSFVIPSNVSSIGNCAFNGCNGITNVIIQSNITNIGFGIFAGCDNLKSIYIPNSVTNIENNAFDGCSSLLDIYYAGSETDGKELFSSIDTSVVTIHYNHIHKYGEQIFTEATCTEDGVMTYTCECGDISYTEVIPACHDYIDHGAKAPTCEGIGWEAYQTCSRCDYNSYKEISALDHDYVNHKAKAPTCEEIGWDAYQTCSRCDYTSYNELSALGHNYVDGICTRCKDKTPERALCDAKAEAKSELEEAKKNAVSDEAKKAIEDAVKAIDESISINEITGIKADTLIAAADADKALADAKSSAKSALTEAKKNAVSDYAKSAIDNAIKAIDGKTSLNAVETEKTNAINYALSADKSLADAKAEAIQELEEAKKNAKTDEQRKVADEAISAIDNATNFSDIALIKNDALKEIGKDIFAGVKINVAPAETHDFRTIVTIKATATNVPDGYILALYVGDKVIKGTNKEVSCEYGELKSNIKYYVKIVDKNGTVQKNADGKELSSESSVNVNKNFFTIIIAFFKGIFGTLPKAVIKPQ